MSDESITLAVRVPREYAPRIDALIGRVPLPTGMTSMNRSVIARLALELGLKALEQQHPAPAPPPRSKR